MRKYTLLIMLLFLGMSFHSIMAQTTPAHALKNVTLHNSDGSVTESVTIVWRNGVIEAVGTKADIPFDAYEIDGGDSLHVYPGFINGFSNWGSPETPRDQKSVDDPGNPPYDRAGIQPERKSSDLLTDDKNIKAGMKAGFTTAALNPSGYMLPGKVEIFYLAPSYDQLELLQEDLGMAGSFSSAPGGWSSGVYPSTLMGVMAKFRQLMYDATALQQHMNYYAKDPEMPAPERDKILEALFPLVNKTAPLYFQVDSKEHIERLLKLQDEFGFKAVIVSGKEAYAKADELKRRNISVLASIDFTDAPDWYKKEKASDEDDEKEEVNEEEKEEEMDEEPSEEEQAYRTKRLEAWKAEVMNIRSLMDAGVKVGFATAGMDLKDLPDKMKILLDEGSLTEKEVVQLMTANTANILGFSKQLGSVSEGKNASFSVFDKAMNEDKAAVLHSISNGTIHEFKGE